MPPAALHLARAAGKTPRARGAVIALAAPRRVPVNHARLHSKLLPSPLSCSAHLARVPWLPRALLSEVDSAAIQQGARRRGRPLPAPVPIPATGWRGKGPGRQCTARRTPPQEGPRPRPRWMPPTASHLARAASKTNRARGADIAPAAPRKVPVKHARLHSPILLPSPLNCSAHRSGCAKL